MKSRLTVIIAAVAYGHVALADYEEVRELTLDTRGIGTLEIGAGAGSMDIRGVPGATAIRVKATIHVPGRDDDKARDRIASDMTLDLEKQDDVALLRSWFDNGSFSWGDSPSIRLEVEVPGDLRLVVDDGSGSIGIADVRGDIRIDDGSGSLEMRNVGGRIDIDDGSGSIAITGAGGNVSINDGSGSIKVRGVSGSVTVDDGSGSIDVRDVDEDLIIVDDGSGGLDFSNIGGRVRKDS